MNEKNELVTLLMYAPAHVVETWYLNATVEELNNAAALLAAHISKLNMSKMEFLDHVEGLMLELHVDDATAVIKKAMLH